MPTRLALFPALVAVLLPLALPAPARAALVCPNPPRVIDATSPVPVVGDTTGGTSSADVYPCADSAYGPPGPVSGYSGPEDVYEFTLTTSAAVSFVFSGRSRTCACSCSAAATRPPACTRGAAARTSRPGGTGWWWTG